MRAMKNRQLSRCVFPIAVFTLAILAGQILSAKPIDAPASTHPLDCMQIYHPLAGSSYAATITDPVDRQLLKVFLDQVERSSADCTPERMKEFAAFPEEIAWRASKLMRMPLVACRLTGDRKYLDTVRRADGRALCVPGERAGRFSGLVRQAEARTFAIPTGPISGWPSRSPDSRWRRSRPSSLASCRAMPT